MTDLSHDADQLEPSSADRATLLITVGSSSVAFAIGFNYGAFDTVFFDRLFTVWVIATIVLVASIITRLPPHTWPRRIALLLPTLWLIVSWIDNNMDVANSESALQVVALAVTLIALPFVGWFLITAINTDFAELPRTHKTAVVGTTALFLVVGFIFGARNDALLTCEDFKVSGNDQPQNCTPASSQ